MARGRSTKHLFIKVDSDQQVVNTVVSLFRVSLPTAHSPLLQLGGKRWGGGGWWWVNGVEGEEQREKELRAVRET